MPPSTVTDSSCKSEAWQKGQPFDGCPALRRLCFRSQRVCLVSGSEAAWQPNCAAARLRQAWTQAAAEVTRLFEGTQGGVRGMGA